jgi:hypothetical protein
MKSNIIFLAIFFLFTFACTKDKTAPSLTISSPAEGTQASGTILIKGTVQDRNLKLLTLNITNDASGANIYNKEITIQGLESYTFNEQYTPGIVIGSSNVTLTVDVEDTNGNRTTKRVKFTIVP